MSPENTPVIEPESNKRKEITWNFETDNNLSVVGFRAEGKLTASRDRLPLADNYTILLPESLSELANFPEFPKLLRELLELASSHSFTMRTMREDIVDGRNIRDSLNLIWIRTLGEILSFRLQRSNSLDQLRENNRLKELLSKTVIDIASAWSDVPEPNDTSFPNMWKARVFGADDTLKRGLSWSWQAASEIPPVRFYFNDEVLGFNTEEGSRAHRAFLQEQAIPAIVNENVFPLVVGKPMERGNDSDEQQPMPLSRFDELLWPNATYAVDAAANNWPSPLIVVDQKDSIKHTHVNYLRSWMQRFSGTHANVVLLEEDEIQKLDQTNTDYVYERFREEWARDPQIDDNTIVISPLLMPSGPGMSSEVVSGPNVSRYGLLITTPGEVPPIYKKLLAFVMRTYTGLEALDYYTTNEGDRALEAFDTFENDGHIQSNNDRVLLKGFFEWISQYRIVYRSPDEEMLRKVGMSWRYHQTEYS